MAKRIKMHLRKYLRFHWLLMFLLLTTGLTAQEMVKFSPDYEFNEGFFINFEQVKGNSPIPAARIITDLDHTSHDFYNKVLDGAKIAFFDGQGVRHEVDINKIWGFSRNGVLYIRVGQVFNRVTFIGSICHFVATITTYNTRYYDPYYYNPYSPYRYMYSPSTYSSSEMRQFLMDFKTGKVYDYNENNVAILLMEDPELHDEYESLRRRKKKQLKFMYIRKFNERNPLYLPANKF